MKNHDASCPAATAVGLKAVETATRCTCVSREERAQLRDVLASGGELDAPVVAYGELRLTRANLLWLLERADVAEHRVLAALAPGLFT